MRLRLIIWPVIILMVFVMGSVTAQIKREKRQVIKMGDGGNGENGDQEDSFDLSGYSLTEEDKGFDLSGYSLGGEPSKDAYSEAAESADFGVGGLTLGSGEGGEGTATQVEGDRTLSTPKIMEGGDGKEEKPKKLVPKPEPKKEEVAEKAEKRPVITRARRRRSLLTEEEGGILRKRPVHRRSILGR